MSITTADDLLRPTSQPPSHEEMSGVIVAASVQAEKDWQGAWTSTPPSMTEAEHYLTTRRAALEHAAKDIYLGAIEHASPDQRDSLLQNLHRQHITLTEWAAAQAAPILSQNDRTALRRDYRTLYGSPIITKAAVQWIARVTAGRPLLEIGAGNGYLASELQAQGVDIIASEPRSFGAEYRHRIPMSPTTCVNMLQATGKEAIALHPDRDIIWSWPDQPRQVLPQDPGTLHRTIPRLHRRRPTRPYRLPEIPPDPRKRLHRKRLVPNTDLPRTARPHHPLRTRPTPAGRKDRRLAGRHLTPHRDYPPSPPTGSRSNAPPSPATSSRSPSTTTGNKEHLDRAAASLHLAA